MLSYTDTIARTSRFYYPAAVVLFVACRLRWRWLELGGS
jgi:hypothetical protein